ncbi:metalloregulator ArsR/SmtB family transcription factor [Rhodobacter sp. Har01]|uniref:ArsR/SmtB family transcription factor n=1 Tax=Rhodobacter sp. Har01 TaxID=2883999 RepID=UPI001D083280|nr:metalloregulator ArsR/SmtB family transcription factor [Rhodobacter sp. Har01]MCB6177423.1 metalloregulator ArsR/SmtB family transcription factor [Rhodobacter sp. Har01]
MERSKALAALSALAHGDRLDLIRLLVQAGGTGLPAGEIARALGLSASRLSFHLSALEQAGLLRSQRVARNVIYAVDAGGLGAIIAYLLNDCCMEHPEVVACCRHGRSVAESAIRLPGSAAP